jgi:hypothetical protein
MSKTHLIINNFFTDPKEIAKFALKQKFYTKENHPSKITLGVFPGHRTDFIHNLNKNMYEKLCAMTSSAVRIFIEEDYFDADCWLTFSYTTKDIKTPQWHTDAQEEINYRHKVAGIIYLNEKADPSSGTCIIVDGKGYNCSNEFNKLFMYRTDITHSAMGTFGNKKSNARLTMTFLFCIK